MFRAAYQISGLPQVSFVLIIMASLQPCQSDALPGASDPGRTAHSKLLRKLDLGEHAPWGNCPVEYLPLQIVMHVSNDKSSFDYPDKLNAHDAFMALPPYTRIREGEAPQLGRGPKPCRQSL